MRLGFHVFPRTVAEYLHDLGAAVEDANTLVFLDTNILAYIYKLHGAARKDLFNWANDLGTDQKRLFIPGWAANEYLAKFKSGKLAEYAPARPEQVFNSLNGLMETAGLFVDEDSLKKTGISGTRETYLAEFDEAIEGLKKYTSVFNQQFDTWSVHHEITSNLSQYVLNSNLAELCSRAVSEGEARITHRLPPGFKDSGKGENKHGDLIIWYEILEKSKEKKSQAEGASPWQVVFVTNDEKPDWVYAPQKCEREHNGKRFSVSNKDPVIKLPDPRLVAEFHRYAAHDNLHITTLPMLVKALSIVRPKDFENLASAIQIVGEDQSEAPETPTSSEESPEIKMPSAEEPLVEMAAAMSEAETFSFQQAIAAPEISDSAAVPQVPVTGAESQVVSASSVAAMPAVPSGNVIGFEYPPDALRDGAYEDDAPSAINDAIRALRSHNWYTQNPSFQMLKEFRDEPFEPGQWFVLGRNVYQAACGNAQKALEFLKNLDIELSRFPEQTANHLLSGMLFEVYFTSDGTFRRHPKATHMDQIMREVTKPRYQQSRDSLLSHLAPYDSLLPFKPGDTVPLILEITVAEVAGEGGTVGTVELQSVKFCGEERLRAVPPDAQLLNRLWFIRGYSAKRIKTELCGNYAIPAWGLDIQMNLPDFADATLAMPEHHVLNLGRTDQQ